MKCSYLGIALLYLVGEESLIGEPCFLMLSTFYFWYVAIEWFHSQILEQNSLPNHFVSY